MAGNYSENNNKTGYPLNGGVKPTVTPEFAEKYDQLVADYNALNVSFNETRQLLLLEQNKSKLLEEHLKDLQELLRLSICRTGGAYTFESCRWNGPKDIYGNPVPYCSSQTPQATSEAKPSVLSSFMTQK